MYIILDTNIVFTDWNMDGALFMRLFDTAELMDYTICFPEIVIDEIKNKFLTEITTAQKKLNSGSAAIERMSKKNLSHKIEDNFIAIEVERYNKRLKRILKDKQITVLKYPSVDHKKLVKKIFAQTKPFNVSEVGYRDAILWETIKELMNEVKAKKFFRTVAFISNNQKDFFTNEFKLHNDLKDELRNEGIDDIEFEIYRDLSEFITKYVDARKDEIDRAQLSRIKEDLLSDEYDHFSLKKEIQEVLNKRLLNKDLDNDILGLRYDIESISITNFDDDFTYSNVNVIRNSSTDIMIEADIDIDCSIDFFVSKNDYYHILDENSRPKIMDGDWNNHYMLAYDTRTIRINIFILVSNDLDQVIATDVKIGKTY